MTGGAWRAGALNTFFTFQAGNFGCGQQIGVLRRVDRSPVELQFARHAPATADRMLAEHHAVLRRLDGERAQVE